MTGSRSLTHDEREQLFERRIRPDLLAGAMTSESPAAMIVAGQPGAGVPSAAATLRRELSKTTGPVVQLSEARLRAYHPAWRVGASPDVLRAGAMQPDVSYWFDRIVQESRGNRFHLLVEDELRDPRSIQKLAAALRKDLYVVQAVFLATNRDESTLFAMAQFELSRERGLPPRFVSAQEHDVALGNVRTAMGLLEDRRTVDGLRVIDRNASQFYENRLVDGEWIRAPRAQASLDVVRDKPRTPKDLVKLAMRWETLARHLAHDPSVPRDVASQTLVWRSEAAARCEAAPASAQMLQWAREGAAFRVMDRFEFVREFPHHERAVKSLGAAVIEAEKYDAAESARFLASARENIAQRIERGDMARIAAREKAQEPPTR
ncbi:zeta toxin family protein [Variovorax fucosicus]|uniref:zeta toxin family protein n=1 Tax=Variovorax fucosicus TaxID=3053517 RepID=UPI002577DF58|nr:zeta toxin family protein [Variovorax sp. J22G47]MDM0058941.1 zeta toxin family protein [Variovorax sp. J22G47]